MKTTFAQLCFVAAGILASAASSSAFAAQSAPTGTTAGVAKVVHIPGMDKAPVPVKQVAPEYPLALREQGVQGFATVDLLVDSTGRVVDAALVRSTNPEFAQQALEAARQWTFEPAEARGQKIMTRVQVPFQFVMPQIAALERAR